MATEIVRPTSVISAVWTVSTVGNVDDVVTQPTAGDGLINRKTGTAAQAQGWNHGTPTNTGTITAVTVWVYCRDNVDEAQIDSLRIRLNGSWTTYSGSLPVAANGSYTWHSFTFTGLSVDMATSAPAVEITASGADSTSRFEVDVLYMELTYTSGGGSSNGSFFFGVG